MDTIIWLFSFLLFFIVGHYFSALFLYLVHRFVFHGKLRRYPGLKHLARLHGLHHAHVDSDVDNFIFVPWWISMTLTVVILSTAYLNLGLAIGILSFALLYRHRHLAIHKTDKSSRFFYHHDYHHHQNVLKNFSGIYPFIDRVFNTFEESYPKNEIEAISIRKKNASKIN